MLSNQGEWVWVKPSTKDFYDLPFAGKILRTDKEKSLILNDDDQEVWISTNQVFDSLLLTVGFPLDNFALLF